MPLAWLLHQFVERPVIGWGVLRQRRQWLTGLVAVGASLAVVVTSGGIALAGAHTSLSSERSAAPAARALDPAGTSFVPQNIAPTLDAVASDNPAVYGTGCHKNTGDTDPGGCQVGDNPEAPLVFLVGDSHAASWYPALEKLAEEGKIRLDSNTKNSCLPLETEQQYLGRPTTRAHSGATACCSGSIRSSPTSCSWPDYDNPERVGADRATTSRRAMA